MNRQEPQNEATERFLGIIESNKGIIYKVANSYCRDGEDRKDLIQEIIIQLWRSRDKYDDAYALSTWIYRVALNVSISAFRKSSRHKKPSLSLNLDAIEIVTPDNQPVVDNDDIRMLHQFIGKLKELDRALILLYLDEKSHQEISEILGLSMTNIATKINRIKTKLKSQFEQERQQHE